MRRDMISAMLLVCGWLAGCGNSESTKSVEPQQKESVDQKSTKSAELHKATVGGAQLSDAGRSKLTDEIRAQEVDKKNTEAKRPEPVEEPVKPVKLSEYRLLAEFCGNPALVGNKWNRPTRASDLTAAYFSRFEPLLTSEDGRVRAIAREELATVVLQYKLLDAAHQRTPSMRDMENLFGKTLLENLGRQPEEMKLGEFLGETLKWSLAFQAADKLTRETALKRSRNWERLIQLAPTSGGPAVDKPRARVYTVYKTVDGSFGPAFNCRLFAKNTGGSDLHHVTLSTTGWAFDGTGKEFPVPGLHYFALWKAGEEVELDVGPFYFTPTLKLVTRIEHSLWCQEHREEAVTDIQSEAIGRLADEILAEARSQFAGHRFQHWESTVKALKKFGEQHEPTRKKVKALEDEFRPALEAQRSVVKSLVEAVEGKTLSLKIGNADRGESIIFDVRKKDTLQLPYTLKLANQAELKGTAVVTLVIADSKKKPVPVLRLAHGDTQLNVELAEGGSLRGRDFSGRLWVLTPPAQKRE